MTVRVEGRPVLQRLTWRIRAGEAWGVTGPNGAGKSTLLRLLAGEEQPADGAIRRLDLGPRADADQVRRRVGLVSPELQARHRLEASGEAVVLSGFLGSVGLAERPTPAQRRAAARALARLGLAHLRERSFLSCSYGEQRLLLVARALVARPAALLLDEPFAGLSPQARRALAADAGVAAAPRDHAGAGEPPRGRARGALRPPGAARRRAAPPRPLTPGAARLSRDRA